MTSDTQPSGWEKGKSEALKRFGKQQQKPAAAAETDQPPAETHTGPAAGVAEARRRFGTRKAKP
jgi:hypothetical protein